MKKLMALVLSFGLVLLGMAASQTLPSSILTTSLSIPAAAGFDIPGPDQARHLNDEELRKVNGEVAPVLANVGEFVTGVAAGIIINYIYDYRVNLKSKPKKCKCGAVGKLHVNNIVKVARNGR